MENNFNSVRDYLGLRLLLIIPTLIVVSMVGFFISKKVTQDPVIALLNMRGMDDDVFRPASQSYVNAYKELGLDKPNFYFSIIPGNYHKDLHTIYNADYRSFIIKMVKQGHESSQIMGFLKLFETSNLESSVLKSPKFFDLIKEYPQLQQTIEKMDSEKSNFFFPKLYWHGMDNQYHHWIKSFFNGTFGISIVDGKPALQKAKTALLWTLSITLTYLIISMTLGILLGIFLAKNPTGKLEQFISQVLYVIYSMPLFWLATLLIVFFTSSEYGLLTNIFPSMGIDVFPGESPMRQIMLNMKSLILPIFCLSIHSLAYISRFVRRNILNEMDKDYIVTAYSKGLSRQQVLTRHALPNAMIPVITIFSGAIPGAFSGSLILEVLFNIPGFGRLLFTSISQADWNVSYCILMIVAVVTVFSYLLGDILYAFFNPKFRLGKS